jgi:hypothetical protein
LHFVSACSRGVGVAQLHATDHPPRPEVGEPVGRRIRKKVETLRFWKCDNKVTFHNNNLIIYLKKLGQFKDYLTVRKAVSSIAFLQIKTKLFENVNARHVAYYLFFSPGHTNRPPTGP